VDEWTRREGTGREERSWPLPSGRTFCSWLKRGECHTGDFRRSSTIDPNPPGFLHEPPVLRQVEELAGPHHTHCLILFPIEVPGRRVHRDDELGARRQCAFQKTIVRFVQMTLSSVSG
jgi:hypothetical protein